jgi:glutathione S-transferase
MLLTSPRGADGKVPAMNLPRPILYSGPLSMFGAKAEIAFAEKGVDFELVMVDYESNRGYEPRHPEVLRINPKRQVPVLVHGTLEIFDSTQIFEYLEALKPGPPLWPGDAQDQARARLLEHQSDEVYFPHVIKLMGLQQALDGEPARTAIAACDAYYAKMDALLDGRDWLAGRYSFADIAFFMAALFGERQGAVLGHATPRLLDWRARMMKRTAVHPVVHAMARWLAAAGRPVPAFMRP